MKLGISIKDLGFPDKFDAWRPGQEEAITECVTFSDRFIAQVQPTGSGKSICYVAAAKILGSRTLILTSTKILQEQIHKDFPDVVVVKGKQSYPCRLTNDAIQCDQAPCRLYRYVCPFKHDGCYFYDVIRKANDARIVITNYAFQSHNSSNDTLGEFDFLVCDEGHDVPQQLLGTLCTTILHMELQYLHIDPADSEQQVLKQLIMSKRFIRDEMTDMAKEASKCGNLISLAKDPRYRLLDNLLLKLDKISAPGKWVLEPTTKGIDIDPLWPRDYAESHLFRNIKKILLTSATFSDKILALLGIKQARYTEYDSCFPIESRPIIYIPTVALRATLDQESINYWLSRIDQIISGRLDRKGIIHAVSYARCKAILEYSEYADMMITHKPGKVDEALDQLKYSPVPKILVSPTCVTGIDLPYTDCEYQIIGKIPFPDLRRKVDKIRKQENNNFGMTHTAQNLQQAVGRGMRAQDDRCENLIIDDQFKWFPWKFQKDFNKWFLEAVRTSMTIPKPLAKLERRRG